MQFRNLLAITLEAVILGFWGLQAYGLLQNVNGEVNGALIAVFTLVAQFYFRKKPADEKIGEIKEKEG